MHVNSLYVNEDFRKNSVGKRILAAVLGESKYKEKRAISVVPVDSAKSFYRSFGFMDSNKYHQGGMIFKLGRVHWFYESYSC